MAVYYVDPANGSDSNTGLNPTTEQWLTTQYALDNVAAGDEVRLMNTQAESITVQIDCDTTAGIQNARIKLVGADSSGDALNGSARYIIRATGSISHILELSVAYYDWIDIEFDGNSNADDCIGTTAASTMECNVFYNCDIHNASSNGVGLNDILNNTTAVTFIGGNIRDNGARGITGQNANDAPWKCYNVKIYDNTTDGAFSTDTSLMHGCVVFGNGGRGWSVDATYSVALTCISNVFFGNTSDGLGYDGGGGDPGSIIMNTVFAENGGYGAKYVEDPFQAIVDYNCYYLNTSGATDQTVTQGTHNVTANPLFTNTGAGTEDFTLQIGSPCIDVGFGYNG